MWCGCRRPVFSPGVCARSEHPCPGDNVDPASAGPWKCSCATQTSRTRADQLRCRKRMRVSRNATGRLEITLARSQLQRCIPDEMQLCVGAAGSILIDGMASMQLFAHWRMPRILSFRATWPSLPKNMQFRAPIIRHSATIAYGCGNATARATARHTPCHFSGGRAPPQRDIHHKCDGSALLHSGRRGTRSAKRCPTR